MLEEKTLDELRKLFGVRAMVRVLQYQAVALSTRADNEPNCTSYQDKIERKFLRLPHESSDSAWWAAHALLACSDFQGAQQYDGFQGCVVPTLLDCMKEYYITSGDVTDCRPWRAVEKGDASRAPPHNPV